MNRDQAPFWKRKLLNQMTPDEWESLCDGCGICCLQKVEDKTTGEIELIAVSCEFLDTVSCRCMIYTHRFFINPDCVELTPFNVMGISWLPDTCAYRCIFEGRALEWWHPLVSGDPRTVHKAGISVRDRAVSGQYVHPEDIRKII